MCGRREGVEIFYYYTDMLELCLFMAFSHSECEWKLLQVCAHTFAPYTVHASNSLNFLHCHCFFLQNKFLYDCKMFKVHLWAKLNPLSQSLEIIFNVELYSLPNQLHDICKLPCWFQNFLLVFFPTLDFCPSPVFMPGWCNFSACAQKFIHPGRCQKCMLSWVCTDQCTL